MYRSMRLATPLVLAFLLAGAAAAQTTGAVFTTSKAGRVAPGNTFTSKQQVYVNGGPGPTSPCTAAGLADGPYYFQVTDLEGTRLLSTDLLDDRVVLVSGGVISGTTGSHAIGRGDCSSTPVQLVPFSDTPSPTGEYRVWLTPTSDLSPIGAGFFGFLAPKSKTSVFRVQTPHMPVPQTIFRGTAFYDFDENGLLSPGVPEEVPLAGWRIEIIRNGVVEGVTFTNVDGVYEFIRDRDGSTYTIREIAPGAGFIPNIDAVWLAKTPKQGIVVANAPIVAGPTFGSVVLEPLVGAAFGKGFWKSNGAKPILQACDPLWREVLAGPPEDPVCLRDNTGAIFTLDPSASFASAFATWASYLGSPANGQAGFMLSSQMAPAILNRHCGGLGGTIYVNAQQDGVLVSFEDLLHGATALLCDPNASDTGPNTPFPELRDAMLNCYKEFESINATGSITSTQVVFRTAEVPADADAPYVGATSSESF